MYFALVGNEILVLGKVVIWFVMQRMICRSTANKRGNPWIEMKGDILRMHTAYEDHYMYSVWIAETG